MKQRPTLLLGLLLVVGTVAVYWPATGYDFIVVDDGQYVVENPWVNGGLSLAGLKWAFTSFHAANWHPLTWLSHQFDCSLHGLFAGGHHLTNLILHVLNAWLLFWLLHHWTHAPWRSFLVAALFAWHPLHVESVAWIAERKDVLSTFFLLLTLWMYGCYARQKSQIALSSPAPTASPPDQPGSSPGQSTENTALSAAVPATQGRRSALGYYVMALFFFACGLMSKPMLVTLPCVLLLLDFWPFNRWNEPNLRSSGLNRFIEKLPFFALSGLSCIVTIAAQQSGGAVKGTEQVPLVLRTLNVPAAYVQYIINALCPVNLCIFYPLPARLPIFSGIASALALAAITVLLLWEAAKRRWLAVGWLWFLGTLVPVIGLIQVGSQALADRYTYVPLIGLFLLVVWGVDDWLKRLEERDIPGMARGFWPLARRERGAYPPGSVPSEQRLVTPKLLSEGRSQRLKEPARPGIDISSKRFRSWRAARAAANLIALGALLACLAGTRHQLAFWHDSVSLFTRAVVVARNNPFAQNNLGVALANTGQSAEAIVHYKEALRLRPNDVQAHYNLGVELAAAGDLAQASSHFSAALKTNPRSEVLHNNLGVVLAQQQNLNSALEHFREAIQLNPAYPKSYVNCAMALQRLGDAPGAFTNYSIALHLDTNSVETLDNFAFLLATCPEPLCHQPATAVFLASRAVSLTHGASARSLDTLATAYAVTGQFSNAVATAEMAWKLARVNGLQTLAAKLERDLAAYQAERCPPRDWKDPEGLEGKR